MAKLVLATERGYWGGEIRDPNTPSGTFSIPDVIWNDPKRRPSWVEAADGKDENVEPVKASDFPSMTVPELRARADELGIDLTGLTKKADIIATIEAGPGAPKEEAAPFGDAPAPQHVKAENEIAKATGGIAPDWIAPGTEI